MCLLAATLRDIRTLRTVQWVTDHPVFVNAAGDVTKLQIFSEPPPFLHDPLVSDFRRNFFSLVPIRPCGSNTAEGTVSCPIQWGEARIAHAVGTRHAQRGNNDFQLPD